jgi:ABC-2 type transport system permease protein
MSKVFKVIKREYWERVRKKSFIILTLIGPILMGGMIVLPMFLTRITVEEQKKIAIVDLSGKIYQPLVDKLDDKIKGGERRFIFEQIEPGLKGIDEIKKQLSQQVEKDRIDAYIIIEKNILEKGKAEYLSKNVANIDEIMRFERAISEIIVNYRLNQRGLDHEEIKKLTKPINLKTIKIIKGQEKESGFVQDYMATMVFVIILYMTILLYGITIARGVIEEKSNRVIEILISSLSPFQLMFGKILGIGAVGLTQYIIWGAFALSLSSIAASVVGTNVLTLFAPETIFFFIIFFILGFLLFGTMYAAIGALCNTEQEMQNFQPIVVIFLVVPMLMAVFIVQNPNSTVATVLSFIPFFTPILMFMRINLITPSALQIGTSIALTIITILLMIKLSAKIFRVGILMYGKRPRLPEIIKWLRYK